MEMNWNSEKSEQWNSRSGTGQADPGRVCINDYVCRIFSTAAVLVGSDGEQTTSVVGRWGGGRSDSLQTGKR